MWHIFDTIFPYSVERGYIYTFEQIILQSYSDDNWTAETTNLTACEIAFRKIYSSQEGRPDQRNLSDSAALAAKVAKKAEMKQKQEEDALRVANNIPVIRKKTTTKKEEEDLDALLSVGLPGKKK